VPKHAISEGHVIAHRLTASEPMIARMRSALAAEDWPSKMPAALATCQGADGAPRMTRRLPRRVICGFSPIVPRTGEAIIEANRVFSEAARETGHAAVSLVLLAGLFLGAILHFILATPVTEDPATNKRYREGFKKIDRNRRPARLGRVSHSASVPKIRDGCVFVQ